jgi:hypothetical protein
MLKDPSPKKGWFLIVKEILMLSIQNRNLPTYYAKNLMYLKDSGNYKDYLTPIEKRDINTSPRLHRLEFTSLLKNKLASALYFENCGLPIPKMISYNVEKHFFCNGNLKILQSIDDLIAFFTEVMEEYGKNSLFLKHHAELGGVGCYLLKKQDLSNTIQKIGPILLSGSFIHQETVQQHTKINEIYAPSLNTIRFETYIDNDNKKHIRTCYIRFGNDGKVVDNSFSGGIYVPISLKTGQLSEKAYKKAKGLIGGDTYLEHPDSGVKFKDFLIPYFEEAKELVFECLQFVPDRYIGWDIAISANGPILIEGNGTPYFAERPFGFKKSALGREIIKEIYSK